MKKRNFIMAIIVLVVIAGIVYLANYRKSVPATSPLLSDAVTSTVATTSQPLSPPSIVNTITNVQLQEPQYSASPGEKGAWERAMLNKDRFYDYKHAISFYGKVVDDEGIPISGAGIEFVWTDLSSEGTSKKTTVSDINGLFSLNDATGQGLSVYVSKAGYTRWISKNRTSFEYSVLASPDRHYTPDPLNPVVFVMRKNRQGEALIVRTRLEAKLESGGQSKSFPIGRGDVFVSVERLPNETPNARYWNARVTVPDGRLQLTTEEFPYDAPEEGYTNEFIITNGLSVQGNQGGLFYVKTPKGYGRVMVYYVPNMPWIYAESWFNPNPNSRNLEMDPSKAEIIKP